MYNNVINKYKAMKFTPSKYRSLLDELSGISDIGSDASDDIELIDRPTKGKVYKKRKCNDYVKNIDDTDEDEPMVRKELVYSTPILDLNNSVFNEENNTSPIKILDLDDHTINQERCDNNVFLNRPGPSNNQSMDRPNNNNNFPINSTKKNPGIQVEIPKSPLAFAQLFITRELLEYLTYETNLYAHQRRLITPSLYKNWKSASLDEMCKFLGLTILFGIFKLPNTAMYWQKDQPFSSGIIRNCLSRNRYNEINCFFHSYNNNAIAPNTTDRIIKVRTLKDYFTNLFQNTYVPKKQITIDEGIMPYKGKLSFKVYLPDKPDKYGIKYIYYQSLKQVLFIIWMFIMEQEKELQN